jgi:DNA helicase-2/ATP-dependent DNA helicase PcrA
MSRFLREMPEDLLEGLDEIEVEQESESFARQSKFTSSFAGRFHESPGKRRSNFPSSAGSFAKANSHEREKPRQKEETASDTTIKPKSIAELKAYLEQKQNAAASWRPPSAKENKESTDSGLRAGMRVRHEQFGDGIILSRERSGNDYKLTVTFSRVGKKSLIEKFAKLKAL